jgi:hypothetical protein
MGCARNALAGVGCVTLLAVAAVGAYQYRTPLGRLWNRVTGTAVSADTVRTTGRPSERALARALGKGVALTRPDGPDQVTLTADEMASLIDAGLDPAARAAIDSLRVTLDPGRFTLEGRVRTGRLGRDALGPLAGVVDERESLRMSGPATVEVPGRIVWRPDEFQVRSFPFPASLVPKVVNALTGGRDGAVPIAVPTTVDALEIHGDGVVFYRRTD